jgi:hypothetical protein
VWRRNTRRWRVRTKRSSQKTRKAAPGLDHSETIGELRKKYPYPRVIALDWQDMRKTPDEQTSDTAGNTDEA